MNDYQTKYPAEVSRRLQQTTVTAQITSEYMRQMKRAPELKATSLDSS